MAALFNPDLLNRFYYKAYKLNLFFAEHIIINS